MNVRVLICGKGPVDTVLKDYVHKHRLGSIVHFTGFVSEREKPDYLASAHLAVFPSLGGESFGIVLAEAMAAGAEVVLGGNNRGYREVLGGSPNQLVNPNNTAEFARTLLHYVTNGQERRRAWRWQQQEVRQYDIEHIGAQLLELYKDIGKNKNN